ncbi:hypothetical protein [Flavobacterium sp. SORGH_AS_0622]|uniref:hypothetical protein n=1 Tax=Flavobacterium sp. SORGH_AS_0622 TaxID=3041772 RepID=UPI002788F757|nr:hypothetical protein [Flavobacterium sp. SORGH_AS_0622]MDQ1165899.1 hypothetical protein [Flavobacterium sp. SORGH_AS_0622]
MTQTLTEPIEKLAKNPTDKISWILIIIAIAINLYQLWQNQRIQKTVEKFKNDLAKNQFKFTRYTELQIESLKNLYDKVVDFHFAFTGLTQPRYKTHNGLKDNIIFFQNNFDNMMAFSHKNKILLPEDFVVQLRIIHNKFDEIDAVCRTEFYKLNHLEDEKSSFNPEILYNNPIEEVESITMAVNRIYKSPVGASFESDILTFRNLIESYFKELVD